MKIGQMITNSGVYNIKGVSILLIKFTLARELLGYIFQNNVVFKSGCNISISESLT